MKRLLCPEPANFSPKGLEMAASNTDLVAIHLDQAAFEAAAPEFDAVLIRFNTRIRSQLLEKAPRLRSILSPTTGLDHIDINAASHLGVEVFHLKNEKLFLDSISATSELAMGLILSAIRHIPAAFESVRIGRWDGAPFRGTELSGKILGIVGCGRLGTKLARMGLAFQMKVVTYDKGFSPIPDGVERATSLRELLPTADVLSIHVPLTAENVHMFGETEFSLLKKSCVLVNTSRGAIIDSAALLSALKNKKIAAAALDVLEDEGSIVAGHHNSLIQYAKDHDNLLITPHIGGLTKESVEKTDLYILNRFLSSLSE